ncbi:DsrE family protein [Stappia sp. ES.058]|uniref:DsrE family protein n=1 Tax=Stappia sp. ES.058 TaxID=1881061 RepID=UPI00087A6256|nr:DsrE family protein [Stappia sp. ES.058]SDU34359.1 hypothetical protein SAMN05428979_3108 [Stappia sp. ES.058]
MQRLFSYIFFALILVGPGLAAAGEADHHVAIHVNDNDPKVMNLALNNAQNLDAYYKAKGETVEIRLVTYGPGLMMLRQDKSPVKSRISAMSLEMPNLSFSACGNTHRNMSKKEGTDVALVSEASIVPSGVVYLMELQEKGYAYIKP